MGSFWDYVKRGVAQEKDMNDKAVNLPIPTKNTPDKIPSGINDKINGYKEKVTPSNNVSTEVKTNVTEPKEEKSVETVAPKEDVSYTEKTNDSYKSSPLYEQTESQLSDLGLSESDKAKNMADKNTKDNVSRLAKYLGGGIIGSIADTVGIYGDMVATAKHNLAQAYFQAAGKGGQYKDPLSKEILSKKIGTMIDSVASAIKENNTIQANRGETVLKAIGLEDTIAPELKRPFEMYVGGKISTEEAAIRSTFLKELSNDPRIDDPTFRNAIALSLNSRCPEDSTLFMSVYKNNPEYFENLMLSEANIKLAQAGKEMVSAEIAEKTKRSGIELINSNNKVQTIYNNLKSENQKQMFELELGQIVDSARIMSANANQAEIKTWVDNKIKYSNVLKPYADIGGDILKLIPGVGK